MDIVGYGDTMKTKGGSISKPKLFAAGCGALVLIAVCGAIVLQYLDTRPSEWFKRLMVDPIPQSVTIRHCRSDGFLEETVYLHFTIEPADLDATISRLGFVEGQCCIAGKDAPSWWKQEGTSFSISRDQYGHDRETAMWVSVDRTEVYYFSFFY